jgi:hypothetical protein
VKLIGTDAWQQFVDAIYQMLGDASDDMVQIGFGWQAASLAANRKNKSPVNFELIQRL